MAAGGAIIGALRVVLGADTADFEKGLKEAQAKLGSFAAAIGKQGVLAAAAFATVGAGLALAVKGTINEADKLGKMAQSVGIPVEELSRLKHAADLSDVSLEALGVSVGKLSKNMSEVAGGATGPAAQAFKALGISVTNTDGTLKSSSQVISEVAGKFAGFEDGAAKTALAMALFGKSGAAMIPLLNAGSVGLAEMMAEADKLGIVIDSKTAKAAEAFNDNLTRLGKVKDGIITQVTARMLPALEGLSQVMIDAAKNSSLMDSAAKVLTATLRTLVTAGVLVGATFKVIGEILSSVASAVVLAAQGKFSEAWEALKTGTSDVVTTIKGTANALSTIWNEPAASIAAGAAETSNKIAAPIIQSAEKADAAMKKMAAEAERMYKKLEAEAKRVFEQTRTPAEAYANTIERLNMLHRTGFLDAESYARAVEQAQDKMIAANPHAQNLGSALENAFGRATEKGAQLGNVLQGLLIDLLKMEATTAFKTLLYGQQGQVGGGGMLGGLFKAAGSLFGFANGGSFQVGGSGGIDSQLVAFKASPNERVTVSKPGQSGFGGGAMTVRVSLDNKILNAVVEDGAGRVVARAAPGIAKSATQQTLKELPKQRAMYPGLYNPA